MTTRSRHSDPDYVLDADRGSSSEPTRKQSSIVTSASYEQRSAQRTGARQLDVAVEALPGLTRQRRDRERALPRDTTAPLRHPHMQRRLPAAGDLRRPLSSRQRKARSRTKRAVQDRLTNTQYTALTEAVGSPQSWQSLNDALSDAAGDAQELDEHTRVRAQRIDRAIQAYERANERGHLVYTNVTLPAAINHTNIARFLEHNFRPGTDVHFDRYTAGAHNLHQIEPELAATERTAAFEIQTRRGMYLGRSDSVDDTSHLLPRGMQLRVVSVRTERYARPDGTVGDRAVVQLCERAAADDMLAAREE